jgi:Xaa-Pro aminopeptidase
VDHQLRRERVAARLPVLGVEALLVTRLPNVRYLTGFTGSNAQLVVGETTSVFLTDGRYTEQSRREVPDLERRTSVSSQDARSDVAEACSALGARRVGFESGAVTYRSWQRLSEIEGIELVPLGEEIEQLRWSKDPEEIRALTAAQAATDEGFERILHKLVEGITERDLSLELEWAMRQAGAEGLAFDSIVAFGESAAEPHHHPSGRELRRGDVVKLDFGALVDGYHADMTRTVAFGEPPAEIRELHEVVMRAQQAGMDAIHAGVRGADADDAARGVIADAGWGEAFSHSLGHGVGLEIHEGPGLRRESQDVLPAGAVATVEPGVYVPGLGGVRIEDTVEVTETGCRPLPSSSRALVVV